MGRRIQPHDAAWTLRSDADPAELRRRIDAAESASQYGWGHTIDFGPFTKEGFLGTSYLAVAGMLKANQLWPDMRDQTVIDVGAFTGGLTALMADEGATVHAVDELSGHFQQARVVVEAFNLQSRVRFHETSLYDLESVVGNGVADVVLLSGVLYHLSDMLAGLMVVHRLLKPGGVLMLQSRGIDDFRHSYADFGRFSSGVWWQPTGLCIKDMCEFAGLANVRILFYSPFQCIGGAVKESDERPTFVRGVNLSFDEKADREHRTQDQSVLRPAPSMTRASSRLRRFLTRASSQLRRFLPSR